MTPQEFYDVHHSSIEKHAGFMMRKFHLPKHMRMDLISAGYIAVCRYIHRYDPSLGAQAHTYLFQGIRKEMLGEVRINLSNARYQTHKGIVNWMEQMDDTVPMEDMDTNSVPLEECIDLKRMVEKSLQKNHARTSEMLAMAFDKYACTEMAAEQNVTRQALSLRVKDMKNRLRMSTRKKQVIDRKFA